MFQPRTIGQFRVMEYLKDRFFLEECLVWPLSRDGLVLEDGDGARIAFRWSHDQIIECAIPEEGSAQAVRCFFTYLNFRCPAPEQQTFDMKTKLWLDSPFGISFRQALGLGPELFRHYLT